MVSKLFREAESASSGPAGPRGEAWLGRQWQGDKRAEMLSQEYWLSGKACTAAPGSAATAQPGTMTGPLPRPSGACLGEGARQLPPNALAQQAAECPRQLQHH